jgi:prevent-host-death family protein
MKTVNARQANHEFSDLLSRVERGAEILITKRNEPVAVLSPYRLPLMTPEREKAVQHAIDVMGQGLPWGGTCEESGAKKCTSGDDQHARVFAWRRCSSLGSVSTPARNGACADGQTGPTDGGYYRLSYDGAIVNAPQGWDQGLED